MLKPRRKFVTVLAVLFCALLTLIAALFIPKNMKTVQAGTGANYVSVADGASLDYNGFIDRDVLNKLYSKLAESKSADIVKLSDVTANASKAAGLSESGNNYYAGFNSAKIRGLNGGKDITIKFGGMEWTVVYLTKDRYGDTVATLWLTESSQLSDYSKSLWTYKWFCDAQPTTKSLDYPSNMYSTSYIRSWALNLGTKYSQYNGGADGAKDGGLTSGMATNTAITLTQTTQSKSHPLAPFTMEQSQLGSEKYSLTSYLDMPYQIEYQETLNWVKQSASTTFSSALSYVKGANMPNDAYGVPVNHTYSGSTVNSRGYSTANSGNFDYNTYILHNYLHSDSVVNTNAKGTMSSDPVNNLSNKQNWTAAESWAFDYVWLPAAGECGYETTLTDNPVDSVWGCSENQRSNHNLSIDVYKWTWLRSGHPTNCGNVRVLSLGAADGQGLINEELSVRPAIHLNLSKCEAAAKTFIGKPTGSVETNYNGEVQTIATLGNSKVSWFVDGEDSPYKSGIITTEYKVGSTTYKEDEVLCAKTYQVSFTIADNTYAWSDATSLDNNLVRKINFTIKPIEIELNLEEGADGNSPTVEILHDPILKWDEDNDAELNTIPIIEIVYTGDKLGSGSETDFSKLLPGSYTATARIKKGTGANYKLKQTYSIDFTIGTLSVNVTESENIVWRYNNGSGPQTFTEGKDKRVCYNGNEYTLSIDVTKLPKNVKIDTTKGDGGYLNAKQTDYKNGAYSTTVYLTGSSTDYKPSQSSFTVNWYIDKGLYDLSKVAWNYTPDSFTYDLATHSVNLVIPDDLSAKGLTFMFATSGSVNSAINAGTYTAKITLSGSDNYVTPVNGNTETYIYNGDGEDFPWELEWEINKAYQKFEWNTGTSGTKTQNKDNENFYLPAVIDPDDMVTVKYYKKADFDTETGKPIDGAESVDPLDMIVAKSQTQADAEATYFAVLEFNSSFVNNYQFGTGAYMQFNTFDQRSSLVIAISASEYKYDGNPHGIFGTDVTVTGALQSVIAANVEYEYFSVEAGGAETSLGTEAPVNSGTYKIKVSVSEEGESLLVINGDREFEYTITTRVLEIPTYEGEITYDGEEHDVATLVGLPEGWENYVSISIRSNTAGVGALDGHTVKTVDSYEVTFSIKSGINNGTPNNVEWKDNSKTSKDVTIKIVQLVLHAEGWEDDEYDSYIVFTENGIDKFITYTVKNEAGEVVDKATVQASQGESFTVECKVAEDHDENVEIVYAEGITSKHEFFTNGGVAPVQVALPTIADLTFDGTNQTFVVDYGEFADYIEIDETLSDMLMQLNAGEYKAYFKIKSGQNAVWKTTGARAAVEVKFKMNVLTLQDPQVKEGETFTFTGSAQSATLNIDSTVLSRFLKVEGDYTATNAGDYTFTISIDPSFAENVKWLSFVQSKEDEVEVKTVNWTIKKAKLEVDWTADGIPELKLPEEFGEIEVEHVFTDEEGNVVNKNDLVGGKKYTVTAKLKDGTNFEFVDGSGKVLETPTTAEFGFELENPPESSFPWWIIIVIVCALVLLTLAIVIIKRRRAAADGDEYDEYDYDDEDEEDDEEEYEDDEDGDDEE